LPTQDARKGLFPETKLIFSITQFVYQISFPDYMNKILYLRTIHSIYTELMNEYGMNENPWSFISFSM